MQTSHVQDPPALGFINLAKRSSTGAAGVGSGILEISNESQLSASSGTSFSFILLSCSLWFSSSFLVSVLPAPNTKPEGCTGIDSDPSALGLARKLKASATATLLDDVNPPKLEKMFFFWSSFWFLLLAFLMTRP